MEFFVGGALLIGRDVAVKEIESIEWPDLC